MDKGYQDDFQFDLGWTVQHGASTGWWVRGNPVGTILGPAQCNPDTDVPTDNGNSCFITGNAGGAANTDDVDNGIVTLISPVMDLRGYKKPIVSYQHWFANLGGNTIANDTLFIKVSNGSDTILLDAITSHSGIWKQTIRALPHGYATQNMRLIVSTADKSESDHVLEAAFDAFEVYDLEWTMPVMYSKQNGCSPFQIQFIDLSDDQENRTWTFPGGTPLQSSDKYPVVTYTAPGHFDVQLKTTSREGNIQEYTFEHLVSVFAPPVANFSFDANEREVVFQNTSSSALDFWWDFGDGEASKVRNPVHRYARANEYLVTLRAVNHCGTDRYSMKVPVNLTSVKEMGNIAVIRIWPNPFKNEVIIEYHIPISLQNAVLKVHNTAGQLIEAKKLSGNQGKIRTGQNWPSDRLYVVSVISGEKQLLSRIVFKN
jgi:PKD repeat protein